MDGGSVRGDDPRSPRPVPVLEGPARPALPHPLDGLIGTHRSRRRRWVGRGLVALLALCLVWLGVTIIGSWGDEFIAIDALSVGDCVELDVTADALGPLLLAECDGPHTAEVVHVGAVDEALNADVDAAIVAIREQCANSLAAYTGGRFARSELEFVAALPTADDWSTFRNDFACLAVRPGGGDLEGSARSDPAD